MDTTTNTADTAADAAADTTNVVKDPSLVLCRVVDVNNAMQNSFQKFAETENKTLQELAEIIREELGKLELFLPAKN